MKKRTLYGGMIRRGLPSYDFYSNIAESALLLLGDKREQQKITKPRVNVFFDATGRVWPKQ